MKTNPKPSLSIGELIAVLLTAAGKFLFMDWLNWRLLYISLACLGWLAYIIYRYQKDPKVLKDWGLSRQGFSHSFKQLFPLATFIVLVFIGLGTYLGTNILSWHIIPVLLLYPIWGIIQQFLTIGLVAKNLDATTLPRSLVVFLTAALFGLIHYPFGLLILGTFLMALVYTILYLRGTNLLVLGILHGWLGAFFFYTILARDSWQEVFAVLNL